MEGFGEQQFFDYVDDRLLMDGLKATDEEAGETKDKPNKGGHVFA